jgi:hypothetical protein
VSSIVIAIGVPQQVDDAIISSVLDQPHVHTLFLASDFIQGLDAYVLGTLPPLRRDTLDFIWKLLPPTITRRPTQ